MRLNRFRLLFMALIGCALIIRTTAFAQGQGTGPTGADAARPTVQNPYERIQAFLRARGASLAAMPADARLRASTQRSALIRRAMAARKVGVRAVVGAVIPAWVSIGPHPATFTGPPATAYSGKVDAIVLDPNNANVVYIGTDSGGVWKSLDGGAHWSALTDNTPLLAIGALAMDPSNSNVLYAGTGGDFGFYLEAGLIKTSDGGATWINVAAPFVINGWRPQFKQIAVDPHNGAIVLAATDYGLWRSTDAGTTWSLLSTLTDTDSVTFDTRQSGVAYYTISYFHDPSAGLYKSIDSGATWTHIGISGANPLPASSWLHPRVVIDPTNSANLYVQLVLSDFSTTSANGAIYKSTDGGTNWAAIPIPPLCCQTYSNLLAVNPTNSNVLYAGNIQLYRSLDGGSTWNVMDYSTAGGQVALHSDQHALAFTADGSVMYDGNDGGVYKTLAPAAASYDWQNLNATLATLMLYPGLSIDAGNLQNSFAGTQDNGTVHYQGSPSWVITFDCGDGGATAIDSSNSYNVVIACANRPSVYRSSIGGAIGSFSLGTGIVASDRVGLPPPLVADPSNPASLYFGTYRVYQSIDGAATWNPISPDLNNSMSSTVTSLAVAPSDSNTVYAGLGEWRVQVTSNASAGSAAVWHDITGSLADPPLPGQSSGGPVAAVAVDPQDASTVYIGMQVFNSPRVYMNTNHVRTWVEIDSTLPNSPVNALTLDPDLAHTLYAGTDVGVYATYDNGQSWQILGQGLPNIIVNALVLHRASRTLRAATFGRGAWDLSLPAMPPVFSTSSAKLVFGNQAIGTASASQSITVTNTRRVAETVTSVGVSGDFTATNNCGSPVAAGSSCTVSVVFTPTNADARTGSLSVNFNGGPDSVPLSGVGIITVPPAPPVSSGGGGMFGLLDLLALVAMAAARLSVRGDALHIRGSRSRMIMVGLRPEMGFRS